MTGAVAAGVWAVLPVKGFSRGKSRLGAVLSDPVRVAFARGLFEHVMDALRATPGVTQVLVLTEDDEVASLASQRGAEVLRDAPGAPLAQVVDAGLQHAQNQGAAAALVCMADLPHVTPADFARVVAGLGEHAVVIAPDAAAAGTNLLGLAPPALFASCFGRSDSYAQHLARAAHHRLEPLILQRHGLCFDVDGPEELARLDD